MEIRRRNFLIHSMLRQRLMGCQLATHVGNPWRILATHGGGIWQSMDNENQSVK